MNKNISTILVIIAGVVLSIYVYKELKVRKSVLKMTDDEKKKYILDEEKKIWDIRNNPNLTQEEKANEINKLDKAKQELTEAEQKAIAEAWVKELQAGNIKMYLTPFEKGIMFAPNSNF